jgi:hypothetical protein
MNRRPFVYRFLFLSAVTCLFAAGAFGAVSVKFGQNTVQVSGVSPHGSVVINAALHESTGRMYARLNELTQVVSDDDGDGIVTFDLGHPISPRSLWVIVDVTSGTYAIAAPPGSPVIVARHAPMLLQKTDLDAADQIAADHVAMSVLWVRSGPSGTVWRVRAADGGATDEDHHNNGSAVVSTVAFTAIVGHDQPPKKLKKDDLIIVLDPFEMTYSAAVVQR